MVPHTFLAPDTFSNCLGLLTLLLTTESTLTGKLVLVRLDVVTTKVASGLGRLGFLRHTQFFSVFSSFCNYGNMPTRQIAIDSKWQGATAAHHSTETTAVCGLAVVLARTCDIKRVWARCHNYTE